MLNRVNRRQGLKMKFKYRNVTHEKALGKYYIRNNLAATDPVEKIGSATSKV